MIEEQEPRGLAQRLRQQFERENIGPVIASLDLHDRRAVEVARLRGSIDVVSGEQGEVVQRQSFDAWGKLRDPNDWTLPEEFLAPVIVNRGYTGHERRQDAGLINMGGRLYDPRLGRMANADPYVVARAARRW